MTSFSDRETAIRREEAQDLREAYERGRQDAKASRRRHPVAMTFLIVAAVVGVIVLALAAVNGSFSGAGTVVDQNLSTAATEATPVVRDAASQAGQAVKSAAAEAGDKVAAATDGKPATQPGDTAAAPDR